MENNDAQLQTLQKNEQLLSNINFQKQSFQKEIIETQLVLKDIENKNESYKIIGSIIVKKNTNEIKKELEEKLELLNTRIENLDKKINSITKEQNEIRDNLNL